VIELADLTWSADDRQLAENLGSKLKSALAEAANGAPLRELLSGRPLPLHLAERALSADIVDGLMSFGLARRENGKLRPLFQAKSVEGRLIFSDLSASMRLVNWSRNKNGYVDPMWEGPILARLMVRGEVDKALDIGCGCGVLALTMSSFSKRVVATDVNPRALMLTRFNAALNAVANVDILESDLFSAVEGLAFDRIVFNFPVGMELLPRSLLEAGDQLYERFFPRLDEHLTEHGIAQLNMCVKDWERASFFDSLQTWMGQEAKSYRAVFLELWRQTDGMRVNVRRWLAPFVLRNHLGRLMSIRRGVLYLRRGGQTGTYEIPTCYYEWAARFDAAFASSLMAWVMDWDESSARADRVEELDFIRALSDNDRSIAIPVVRSFRERVREIHMPSRRRPGDVEDLAVQTT